MTLIVWRWAILATQVVRIYRPIRKRDLIVVRVVIRTRKSVRGSKLVMIRKPSFETQQQPVVLRSHTRFEILHDVRSANDRIERHGSDDATDDEVGANVAHVIGTESKLATKLALHARVHLLDHRVLEIIVDDVDAAGSGAGQHKSGERVRKRRGARRKHAVDRIEKKRRRNEKKISGANLDRQRAAVKPAFEFLNLESDAVVVNSVT